MTRAILNLLVAKKKQNTAGGFGLSICTTTKAPQAAKSAAAYSPLD
jgi:hypothetical protein